MRFFVIFILILNLLKLPASAENPGKITYDFVEADTRDLRVDTLSIVQQIFSSCGSQIGKFKCEGIINSEEIKILKELSINFKIKQKDLEQFYEDRILKNQFRINELNRTLSDDNFKLGSMGGFYTIEEINQTFTLMRSKYPQFFKEYEIIGETIENRPIYAYYFTLGDGEKQEVLFNACHHAREVGGVTTLVYFLWDILENAGNGDPEAVYLLKNRLICVIPVLNVDGYVYNETTRPSGGGMWRKNRRKIGDEYGVDLNRNYGPYEFWNAANNGSATNPAINTYRGEAPFSEPETQAIRNLCEKRNFRIAVNYHSFYNVLIYPYGALERESADSVLYRYIADDLTKVNNYTFGTDFQAVGYSTRGNSDDWMYKKNDRKNKIISYTAEIGTQLDGHWPLPDRILKQVRENLKQNYEAVWAAGANIRPARVNYNHKNSDKGIITVELRNAGVASYSKEGYIKVRTLDENIEIDNTEFPLGDFEPAEMKFYTFDAISLPDFINSSNVPVEIIISQDGVVRRDTFRFRMFRPEEIKLFVNSEDMDNWETKNWGYYLDKTDDQFVLSDSPSGFYKDISNSEINYKFPLDITNCSYAELQFDAKWAVETYFDVVQVKVSKDNGDSWQNLKSSRMILGTGSEKSTFPAGDPGFSGNYPLWIRQTLPLENFIGNKILLKFILKSDSRKNFDGIDMKNVILKKFDQFTSVNKSSEVLDNFNIYPNPVILGVNLIVDTYDKKINNIYIFDINGDIVLSKYDIDKCLAVIPTIKLNVGIYFIQIKFYNKSVVKKLIVRN